MVNKHLIWAITLFSIIVVICGTLIYLNNNAWVMRFEMDNNTRDAITSIDFDETPCVEENGTCVEVHNVST